MKNIFKIIIGIAIILILGFFYWYEYRPTKIIKKCSQKVRDAGLDTIEEYYWLMDACTDSQGLSRH